MAQQARIEKRRELVRAVLRNPQMPAAEIKADFAARGIEIEEAAVERLRKIVDLILEEQARS